MFNYFPHNTPIEVGAKEILQKYDDVILLAKIKKY